MTDASHATNEFESARSTPWVTLALLIGLAAVAFRGLAGLGASGSDENLSRQLEGFFFVAETGPSWFALGLAGWLLARRSASWSKLDFRASVPSVGAGALCYGAAGGIAAWSYHTSSADLLAISLALFTFASATVWKGRAGARLVAPAALCLLLAVRVPAPLLNTIAFKMQLWTAEYAAFLLHSMGLTAAVSGDLIVRSTGSFQVIENCSGLRSVQTLTMLAILMSDLFRRGVLHSLFLVGVAPLVAFAWNGVRVVALILNPHSEIVAIHNLQGVAVLLAGVVALYVLDGWLGKLGSGTPRPPRQQQAPQGVSERQPPRWHEWLPVGAAVLLVVVSLAIPIYDVPRPRRVPLHSQIPRSLEGWKSTELEPDRAFLGVTALSQVLYRKYVEEDGGAAVKVFVGLGNHHRATRGPFTPKTQLPSTGWIVEESDQCPFQDRGVGASAAVLRFRTRYRLGCHWTEGSAGFADEVLRSGLGLDHSPWHRRRTSLVIRMSTAIGGIDDSSRERARQRLVRFFRALEGPLDRLDQQLEWKRFS